MASGWGLRCFVVSRSEASDEEREFVDVLLNISISSLELPVSSWTTFFAARLRLDHTCPGVSNISCCVQLCNCFMLFSSSLPPRPQGRAHVCVLQS